ncbi:hypothetical protein D3C71_1598750 [compost metagenome]
MRLELQYIVDQVGDIAEVAEDVVDTVFEKLRCDGLVALGQWLEGIGVNGIVEAEDRSVDRFPGILLGSRLGGCHGRQQQAGADTGLGESLDHTGTDPTHRCLSLEILGGNRSGRLLVSRKYKGSRTDNQLYTFLLKNL